MTPMLTTAQVLGLTEGAVTAGQFRGWMEAGLVVPAEGGGTQGAHRRFSLMQAVGVVAGSKMYASYRGCRPEYVGGVVAVFAGVTREWLEAEFRQGRTILWGAVDGRPHLITRDRLGPACGDVVDVPDVLAAVLAVAAQPDR